MRQLKITASITSRENESLDKYLQEIGKIDLLTPDEEVDLAKRIKMWDNEALEKLRQANLRFVVSVAKQHQNQWVSLSDLISEGNIWLKKAVQRFDETQWFKFITYAVWRIRQHILKAIQEKSNTIRPWSNQFTQERKVKLAKNKLLQTLEREPTSEELAESLDRHIDLVERVQADNLRTVSLDAPVGYDEGSASLVDLLSANLPSPDADFIASGTSVIVDKMLNVLGQREKNVVIHYLWLQGNTPLGRKDLAEKFNMSTETLRNDYNKAIRRIRNSLKRWTLKNSDAESYL